MSLNISVPKRAGPHWGPLSSDSNGLPFSHPFESAAKTEKLGRVCDFTHLAFQRAQKEGRVPDEKTDFRLVDSRPFKTQLQQQQQQRRFPSGRGYGIGRGNMGFHHYHHHHHHNQNNQMAGGRHGHGRGQQPHHGGRGGNYDSGRRFFWQGHGGNRWGGYRSRVAAEWSTEPTPEWTVMHEIPLPKLTKQKVDMNQAVFRDAAFYGELFPYQREYDRILPKQSVSLRSHRQKRTFYQVGTVDDSFLTSQLQNDEEVIVAATDQVLACIMAASLSRLSWHLHIHKLDGKIIIDKADGSSVDQLSVGETSRDPPTNEDAVKINRPAELSQEAQRVNQDFQLQVLNAQAEPLERHGDPGFVLEGEKPAPKLYRYRYVDLPGKANAPNEAAREKITLITRAEIDGGIAKPDGQNSFLTIRAFNEHDTNSGKGWGVQIENQKGLLFATERNNNACKVGRWVAQALIAGSDEIRLGFVFRNSPSNNQSHQVLFVQPHRTGLLASQIGMPPDVAWGQVRYIIDLVRVLPDGNYILLKDPTKSLLKLYKPPLDEDEEDLDGDVEM